MSAGSRYASKVRSRARMKGATSQSAMEDILADVADAVSNLEGAWPHVGEIWQARQTKVFDTESFGRWAPLKAATIMKKRKAGVTTDTLVQSGMLRNEVSSPTPRSSGPAFVVLGPARGSVIEYAKFHLHGNGVPQRNPVPRLTGPERKNFIDAIRDFYRPPDGQSKSREVRLQMGLGV